MTALLASLVGQKSAAPVIPTGDRLDSSGPRKIASRQVNRSPFHYPPYYALLFSKYHDDLLPAISSNNQRMRQFRGCSNGLSRNAIRASNITSNKFTKAHCPGLRAASGWHYEATVHPGDSLRFAPGPPEKDRGNYPNPWPVHSPCFKNFLTPKGTIRNNV